MVLAASVVAVSAADFVVGPGQALEHVNDVPWERLSAGDRVRIHWRTAPYREKFVLCCRGTEEKPIVIEGVPGPHGELPVLDGRDATTRKELNFWGEDRAVIKIGGANRPPDTTPAHIIVRGLEIRSGRKPYYFSGRKGRTAYRKNAASIYIEKGNNIEIDACRLHDSGNGIITAPATQKLTVSRCHLFGNGVEKSVLEHNAYIYATGVEFRFNRFGPLRQGCLGNNFKDRSAGLEFYCNWVEGGNRCLDLVDSSLAGTGAARVWGNVLLKGDGGNNQVVHFGGDSGKAAQYRRLLIFYNNTVVSRRRGNTVFIRRSSGEERVFCMNNIVFVEPGIGRLNLQDRGEFDSRSFDNNWLSSGWRQNPELSRQGKLAQRNPSGTRPGFMAPDRDDFHLRLDSECRGRAKGIPDIVGRLELAFFEYVPHQNGRSRNRPENQDRSLGAFSSWR